MTRQLLEAGVVLLPARSTERLSSRGTLRLLHLTWTVKPWANSHSEGLLCG
jgi:hypothetical protein